ncbi:interleukin-18 receptor accessory protein [Poecilia reticulata]|nr:PREDICTED: interleukin-18 receptor accessory protein [Poecilia reticulata]
MRTGIVLFYFFFPTIAKGCCGKNRQQRILTDQPFHHYKAVEGEVFVMPCDPSEKSPVKRAGADDGKACGEEFVAKDAGENRSFTGSNSTLQVIAKTSLRCFEPEESSVMLLVDIGGRIPCPGHACYNNTGVVWYKKNRPVSIARDSCVEDGELQLCTVYREDTGVFYCDRRITEQGVAWVFRRAVHVKVIPFSEANSLPVVKYPAVNMTEEVELGQPHNLTCEVDFDFEVNISRKVEWFMNYGGDMDNMTLLDTKRHQEVLFSEIKVTQTYGIKEVTPQHLKHAYTCFASNAVGNNSVTIKLKQKKQGKWPSLVGYPFGCFLLVVSLGIILHVKWVELQLIFRSRFQFGKDDEEKEFDVFVSYVWTGPSAEAVNGLTISSKPYSDAGEMQSREEPIEMRLPRVLEDQWGYRVCLLERDILPGGAYTNDVVLTINRSRMLICVLSAEYFASSNAVFVLESGVKALLQNSALKMLLIWTRGTSASFTQPEPPLPKLVQRALKVLPSLQWSTDAPSTAARSFWISLQKAMPADRARPASRVQCEA